jgi:hypothetical protein
VTDAKVGMRDRKPILAFGMIAEAAVFTLWLIMTILASSWPAITSQ